jgi:hypothetical protein
MLINKWYSLYKKLKGIVVSRKLRGYLYIAAVLWVAVATQVVVNKAFREELKITDAFIKSETDEMQSRLEIMAEYTADVIDVNSANNIISELADSIGLKIDNEISIWEDENRIEYSFFKQAKQASTELKVISIGNKENDAQNMKNYIIVRLNLQKSIKNIDMYKTLLEASLSDLGIKNKQITMKYEGVREGDLTSARKHELAALLIDELHGEIALEYDEGDLYTVYAYTGMLNEYITTNDTKINIQLVITYNEVNNKTKISLATPVMNEDY